VAITIAIVVVVVSSATVLLVFGPSGHRVWAMSATHVCGVPYTKGCVWTTASSGEFSCKCVRSVVLPRAGFRLWRCLFFFWRRSSYFGVLVPVENKWKIGMDFLVLFLVVPAGMKLPQDLVRLSKTNG
jgi:hypothetical protein